MAKQERARLTRHRVLCAAGEVFAERGYHRASVGEIIARSNVTKGALYFHFASKAEMAAEVLDESDTIAIPDGPVRLQALIILVNGYAAPPLTDPILRGALRLAAEPEFESGAWHERVNLTITGLLAEAAHAGEVLSHVDPAETAELITTMLAGLGRYMQAPPTENFAIDRISVMWRYLLPSIATPALLPALDFTARPPESAASEGRLEEGCLTPSAWTRDDLSETSPQS
ncbi:ScbR family autoregulator-binding transcription factor [Streptomyces sp. NPDC059611]|uniref:ScbR family autoregulator-binding transcription factor n=1 Tax=Streptomyces sp. NPDC059611 TaxID=3346884 RepID=UPI003683CC05